MAYNEELGEYKKEYENGERIDAMIILNKTPWLKEWKEIDDKKEDIISISQNVIIPKSIHTYAYLIKKSALKIFEKACSYELSLPDIFRLAIYYCSGRDRSWEQAFSKILGAKS